MNVKTSFLMPLLAVSLAACVATEPAPVPISSSSAQVSSAQLSSVPLSSSTSSLQPASSAIQSSSIVSVDSSSQSSLEISSEASSSAVMNTAPTANWISPQTDYRVTEGATAVAIEVNVADNEDNLSSVTLYINTQKQTTLNQPPYRWSAALIEALGVGTHTLAIEALDGGGESAEIERTLIVERATNILPTVSFAAPINGDLLPNLTSLDVSINASDTDGEIVNATLYINAQRVAEISQPPFEWPARVLPVLSNLAEGDYDLKAVVTDDRGDTAEAQISFTVSEPNDFPEVGFVAPADNLVLVAGTNIDVIAEASDSDGEIVEVIFSLNGVEIGNPDTTTPFEWFATRNTELKGLPMGDYNLKVTAVDNKGGKSSQVRTLKITNSADATLGDPARGRIQYFQNCLECHGQFGEGTSRALAVIPLKESYRKDGQDYSLYTLIDELMPDGYVSACAGQCAKNVSSYMQVSLTEAAQENSAFIADAQTGKVEYQLHCADCHGEKGLGGSEEVVLFPVSDVDDYPLATFYYYSKVSLFTMIDLGMPYGPNGYPEGYADKCVGQCVADVISYVKELESQLSDQELLQVQIAAGKKQYDTYCAGCHNSDGSRRGIIPLSNSERNNNSLDNNDGFFKYNRDAMPPSNPESCGEQCSKDVTVYIREVLDN